METQKRRGRKRKNDGVAGTDAESGKRKDKPLTEEQRERKRQRDRERCQLMPPVERRKYIEKRNKKANERARKRREAGFTPEQIEIRRAKGREWYLKNLQRKREAAAMLASDNGESMENNDDQPSNSSSRLNGKRFQADFRAHCFFCWRKTTARIGEAVASDGYSSDQFDIVQRANLSSKSAVLLPLLNQIWAFMDYRNDHKDEHNFIQFLETHGISDEKRESFTRLPKMCEFCAHKLETAAQCVEDLNEAILALEKVALESKLGGESLMRSDDFEETLLGSSLEPERNDAFRLGEESGEGSSSSRTHRNTPNANNSSIPSNGSASVQCRDLESDENAIEKQMSSSHDESLSDLITTPLVTQDDEDVEEVKVDADAEDEDDHEDDEFSVNRRESDPKSKSHFETIYVGGNDNRIDFQPEDDYDDYEPDSFVKSESEAEDSAEESSSGDESVEEMVISVEPQPQFLSIPRAPILPTVPQFQLMSQFVNQPPPPVYNKAATNQPKRSRKTPPMPKQGTYGVTLTSDKPSNNTDFAFNPNLDETTETYSTTVEPVTGKRTFTCQINGCGQTYLNVGPMERHQLASHNYNAPFVNTRCKACNRVFQTSEDLRRHQKRRHQKGKEKPYLPPIQRCDLCKVEVPIESIIDHAKEHVGTEGLKYIIKCPNKACSYIFFSARTLAIHVKGNSQCLPFNQEVEQYINLTKTCEICGFNGSNLGRLKFHISEAHETPMKNFSCPVVDCQQKFTVKQSVMIHITLHDFQRVVEKQKCNHCEVKIKVEKMEEHLRMEHQAQEVIKCTNCPMLFSSRELLLDHLFIHRFGGLSCDICNDGVKFLKHFYLREHYFQVHKIGSKLLCEICNSSFWTKEHLKQHSERHDKEKLPPPKKFPCDLCYKELASLHAVRNHKIREHGAKPYACTFCSETFTSAQSLLSHKKQHIGVPEQEFRCEVEGCGQVFKFKSKLKIHHSREHLHETPFPCKLCGKSFSGSTGLKKHVDGVHLNLRPSVCDICGESFRNDRILNRHALIHTGERPFACEICGQGFRQKSVLGRHLKSHEKKGSDFKPNGPMKQIRKRVERK